MKLPADCLISLAARGYMSIQVPEYDLDITAENGHAVGVTSHVSDRADVVEYPDNWFIRVANSGSIAVGKQSGHLHLSRRGWEANRDTLRLVFTAACGNGLDRTGGEGFPAFVRYAEKFFADIEKKTDRRIQKLSRELDELRNAVI